MFNVNVNGRRAMPLRAVPFITCGLVDGLSLAAMTTSTEAQSHTPRLAPFCRQASGPPRDLTSGALLRMQREMEDAQKRGGSLQELRECIPPDAMVWEDDVLDAYNSIGIELLNMNDGQGPFLDSWDPKPQVSAAEAAFVNEHTRTDLWKASTTPFQVPSAYSADLQSKAEEIARGIALPGGRRPTKEVVAKTLLEADRAATRNRIAENAQYMEVDRRTLNERRTARAYGPFCFVQVNTSA